MPSLRDRGESPKTTAAFPYTSPKTSPFPPFPCVQKGRGRKAFSLIEVMVAMGLLTFIILGLLAMFMQTQRAFRSSITQTDVLEGGRAMTEMLSREIEQATPTHYPDFFRNGVPFHATNFFVELSTNFANPLVQALPGLGSPPLNRTNIVQRFFFLSRVNQDWIGTGYQVVPNDASGCVGTLYRFSMTNQSRRGPFDVSAFFNPNLPYFTNWDRIADGVVHFRVRPFAANGFPIIGNGLGGLGATNYAFYRTNMLNMYRQDFIRDYTFVRNAWVLTYAAAPDQMEGCYFVNDAIPAYVEIELGLLEQQTLQRYKSIPPGLPAARQYLSDHVAQVHIFRQRVPIRNVDLTVYP